MSKSLSRTLELDIVPEPATGVVCPHCKNRLVVDEVKPTDQIRCAGCGARFYQAGHELSDRLNRKALWCLLFALMTPCLFVVTGIPALILGLLALRDKRKGKPIRGQGLAVAGLLLSIFFLFTCGIFGITGLVIAASMERTRVPEEVRANTDQLIECKMPRGVGPKSAQNFMGMREVQWSGKTSATHVVVQFVPAGAATNRTAFKKQFLGNLPYPIESQELVADDPEITRQVFDTGQGSKMHRYYASFDAEKGFTSVVATVNHYKPERASPLTEQEVLDFYDTVKIVKGKP